VSRPVRSPQAPDPEASSAGWWRQPVVYQIYLPSFAATGAGALRGVTARIPYLAALGIDAVWLSPFDASALADDEDEDEASAGAGTSADPQPGTLADFDEMTSALTAHGIKVIADLVPSGEAFDFELLEADWDAARVLRAITGRVPGRPAGAAPAIWVLSSRDAGPRRARAAALLMLALPGSALLYQGEELGLHQIADVTSAVLAQEHDPGSPLNLYRHALGWRRKLLGAESLEWMPGTSGQVLHFRRPGGWRSVTNFGPRAVPLPPGTVIASSAPRESAELDRGVLPADTTAWIISAD
jgi:glycosidase